LLTKLQIDDAVATAAARRRSMILGDVVDGALRLAIVARHAEILGNPGTSVLKRVIEVAADAAGAALLMPADRRSQCTS
jgi:hypothetical protein